MHWFWRFVIAVALGSFWGPVVVRWLVEPLSGSSRVFAWAWYWDQVFALILPMVVPVAICILLSGTGTRKLFVPVKAWIRWGAALAGGALAFMALGRFMLETAFYRFPLGWLDLISGTAMSLLVASVPLVIYKGMTYRLGETASADPETRCRKCQYILRGISEPRCPECGERI